MSVGIVGAGIAGLYAARLLEHAGHEVAIFEATERAGGRIETYRNGETVYDAGGEWIDAEHARVLALCEEFGLPLRASKGARWGWFGGQRFTTDALPEAILEDESRFEEAACLAQSTPEQTLEDLVRTTTVTDAGRWWITANYRSDEGDDIDRIGLTGWLRGYAHYAERAGGELSAFSLERGMQSLTDAIAQGLASPIRFRTPATTISDSEINGECFDHIVVTSPPQACLKIDWQRPISEQKRRAWLACGMARALKVAWEFDRPWWREIGWTGSLFCDEPVQQTWDGTRGETAVLLAYICGTDAQRVHERRRSEGDEAVARSLLNDLAKVTPIDGNIRSCRIHDWIETTGGAFSYMPAGFAENHVVHLNSPEGRIHFAGEHTATWMGFIEGALESAEQAVREIQTDLDPS